MQSTNHFAVKSAADLNLERRVALTLAGLHVPLFRFLRVEATDGTVTLSGRVGSYYERQLAQSRARRVAGVVRLIDQLVVIERPHRGAGGFSTLLTRPVPKADTSGTRSLAELSLTTVSLADVSLAISALSTAESAVRRIA